MIDAKELKDKYGMTDSEVSELQVSAKAYEQGKWPEGKVTVMGRPSMYDGDELENVTFRIRKSHLLKIDRAAKQEGTTRSEFLRAAADEKLRHLAML